MREWPKNQTVYFSQVRSAGNYASVLDALSIYNYVQAFGSLVDGLKSLRDQIVKHLNFVQKEM